MDYVPVVKPCHASRITHMAWHGTDRRHARHVRVSARPMRVLLQIFAALLFQLLCLFTYHDAPDLTGSTACYNCNLTPGFIPRSRLGVAIECEICPCMNNLLQSVPPCVFVPSLSW